MKVTYKHPAFTADEECEDIMGAFEFIGQCEETFGAAEVCPNCKGTDIRPKFRRVQTYSFYSMECHHCKWEFPFGQRKDGTGLFPKEGGWQPPYQNQKESRQGDYQENQDQPRQVSKQQLQNEAPF